MALVASLPADAVFEDNLLVGPATLLAPQPPVGSMSGDEPVRVNHNTFDGLGHAPRAILANEPGRPTADIHFEHNLLLRVAEPLLDEATSSARRVQGRDNVWVPARPRLQGLGVDGAADEPEDAPINPWPGNRVIESIANLRFANVPHERIHFNEPALLARRITVKELRRQLREAYRLRPDSPLLKGQSDDARPAGMLIDAGSDENR